MNDSIPSDQQGMSPNRTATLDGEVSGPNYNMVAAPPGLSEQVDEPVENGAGFGPSSSTTLPGAPPLSFHVGASGVTGPADFLNMATEMTKQPEATARPLPGVPQTFAQDPAVSSGSASEHVGGFNFFLRRISQRKLEAQTRPVSLSGLRRLGSLFSGGLPKLGQR